MWSPLSRTCFPSRDRRRMSSDWAIAGAPMTLGKTTANKTGIARIGSEYVGLPESRRVGPMTLKPQTPT